MADSPTPDLAADPVPVSPTLPPVDVAAEVANALAAQQAQFKTQLKELTGFDDLTALADARLQEQGKLQELAANKAKEAQHFKTQFEQSTIRSALLSAASAAVDSDTVVSLLAGAAVCDDHGKVTVAGKPVAEAVKQLFIDKPFLAKPQGAAGSGAPSAGAATSPSSESLTPLQRLVAARQS